MKEFLSRNGIAFREVDVAEDAEAREEMVRRSGQLAVPTTVIDGHVIVGYDEARLRQLIREADEQLATRRSASMAFTQPELMQLRENLNSELLAIAKLASFAAQVNDPQIKQLCLNMQRAHERHRDMLMRHINAGQPVM